MTVMVSRGSSKSKKKRICQMTTFNALRVTEKDSKFTLAIEKQELSSLPAGDVLIKVQYSSLNFKDVLVCRGTRGLTKEYPHTPGIDAAGIVEESSVAGIEVGDAVLVTGFDLGINTAGGFGEYIRVPAEWVQLIPSPLTVKDVMAYGTAGLTAGLSVLEILENGISPEDGPVAVSGASGGVGSIAIDMLKSCGFSVTAVSNKNDDSDRLKQLGADDVIGSTELNEDSPKALLKPKWAAVVDTVGGTILANFVKETKYGGVVTNCGMVAGNDMTVSVFPFIIRGVRLIGIDSVLCPVSRRDQVWKKIALEWHNDRIVSAYTEFALDKLHEAIAQKNDGKLRGRVLIKIQD
jgi:acrylyl-CoA reductase (NADPH)